MYIQSTATLSVSCRNPRCARSSDLSEAVMNPQLQTSPFDKMRNVSFRKPIPRIRTPSLTRTLSPSSSSSNSTPHTSESPGPAQMDNAPSLGVLSIPPPPESHDEGEYTSLSDLPAPSDLSDTQDLEQDLEQALNDGNHPAEEMEQVQSVASSIEPQEEPSPTFSSDEPTAQPRFPSSTPHAPINRAESQSLSVAQSSPAPSVMFTPTPAFPPRPRPRFFAPGLPSTPAIAEHSGLDNKDLITPYARRRSFLIDVINSTARQSSHSMLVSLVSHPVHDSVRVPWAAFLTRSREAGRRRRLSLRTLAGARLSQAPHLHMISLRIPVPTPPLTMSWAWVLVDTALAASMPGS